jgi:DNA-directed RNA polymerase specialized sigma24 family protein
MRPSFFAGEKSVHAEPGACRRPSTLQVLARDRLAEALPADYRTALVLHDVEDASKPDITEILGVHVPGVKSRLHRAGLFVRHSLSEYFEAAAAVA